MSTKHQDLNDAEIRELDELLGAVPAPWEALDVVLLDGYLAGVLIQPTPPAFEAWWAPIFGEYEAPFEANVAGWSPAQHERLMTLIERRKAVIERGMREEGWFDPIVPILDDEPSEGDEASPISPYEGVSLWVAGMEWALAHFHALEDASLPGVPDLLDSLWRHLPEQDEEQAALTQAINQEHPLRSLDEAIEQMVFDVVDLHDLALQERLRVPTVERDGPKIGRNDPCPCGSGRKYKHCHGADA